MTAIPVPCSALDTGTARRQPGHRLHDNERRLHRALAAGKVGIWEWDLVTNGSRWSDEMFRLLGLKVAASAPAFKDWLASILAEDRPSVSASVQESMARKLPIELVWRTAADGRWLLSRGEPDFGSDGKLVGYIGIAMDITERRRTSHALEEARNVLAEAQRVAHLGSFEFVPASGTLTWSDEQYRIHGPEPGDALPNVHEVIARCVPPEDAEGLHNEFMKAVQEQLQFDRTYRLAWPDGTVRWVRSRGSPRRDTRGTMVSYVGTTQDITDLHQAEELARQRLDEVARLQRVHTANELASVLAHELNQPLAAISAYSEASLQLASGPAPDASKLRSVLERISQQSHRAGDIIHLMRKFVARATVNAEPLDLNAVLRDACTLMRPTARGRGVRLGVELEPGLPRVMGVAVHIEQVLFNLLRNAFDAIAEAQAAPGKVTVRSQLAGRGVRVTVADSGPGIAADRAEALFEEAISRKKEGLGLGLRISRSLIEAHGGRLWVEPHAPGAILHFELPLA